VESGHPNNKTTYKTSGGSSINTAKETMAKFTLSITAHVGNDAMLICSREYNFNRTALYKENPVFRMICDLMPCIDTWDEDDGDDRPGTSYCQYTHYEPGTDNYLLAAWNDIDEETGTIKL